MNGWNPNFMQPGGSDRVVGVPGSAPGHHAVSGSDYGIDAIQAHFEDRGARKGIAGWSAPTREERLSGEHQLQGAPGMVYKMRRAAMANVLRPGQTPPPPAQAQAASPAPRAGFGGYGPKRPSQPLPEILHQGDSELVERWRTYPQQSQGLWEGAPIPVPFSSSEVLAAVEQAAQASPMAGALGGMAPEAFFIAEKLAETLEWWSGSSWVRLPRRAHTPATEFNLTDRIRTLRLLPPRHPASRPRNIRAHDIARLGTTWDQQERLHEVAPEVMAGKVFQPGFAFGPPNLAGAEANLRNVADRRIRAALEEDLRIARAMQQGAAHGAGDDELYGYDPYARQEPSRDAADYAFDEYGGAVDGPGHADPYVARGAALPGGDGPLNLTSFFPVTQVYPIKS